MAATILLTGATGKVGSHLTRVLAERGVPFRALVREPSRLPPLPSNVEVAVGDLGRPETLAEAFRGIERLFLVTAPAENQVEIQGNAVDAALAAGVRRVVKVSVIGVAKDSPVSLGRWHATIDGWLRETEMEATLLIPHSFMQNLLGAIPTIRGQGAIYGTLGEHGKVPLLDARDVGECAAAVLTSEDRWGKDYYLTGPAAVSYADVAALFTEALGRPVSYVDLPPDAYRGALVQAGLPGWLADDLTLLQTWAREGLVSEVSPTVSEILGRPARTIEAWVREFAPAFA